MTSSWPSRKEEEGGGGGSNNIIEASRTPTQENQCHRRHPSSKQQQGGLTNQSSSRTVSGKRSDVDEAIEGRRNNAGTKSSADAWGAEPSMRVAKDDPAKGASSSGPQEQEEVARPPYFKRSSLSLAIPLIRRYSQDVKNSSPWTIAINSTRVKEKKHIEAGITRFNLKPTAGVDYLVNNGIVRRVAEDVAAFIRQHGGELSKRRVGEYVGNHDPFAQEVLNRLLQEYDFTDLGLDEAMRVCN